MNKKKIIFLDPINFMSVNTAGIAFLRGFLCSRGINSAVINFNKHVGEKDKDDFIQQVLGVDKNNIYDKYRKRTFELRAFLSIQQEILSRPFADIWQIIRKVNIFDGLFKRILSPFDGSGYICISVTFTSQVLFVLLLCNFIKKNPGVKYKIILGGPVVTHFKEELLGLLSIHQVVDFLVLGEGETPLYQIIRGHDPKNIYNLIYRKGSQYKYSKLQYHNENINMLPTPKYEKGDRVYLQFSRKCYWGKCRFCVLDKYNYSEKLIFRDVNRVINDLKTINRDLHSFGGCEFLDDCIPLNIINKFSKIRHDPGVRNKFVTFIRCDEGFNYNVLKTMKEAGFYRLRLGPETLVPRLIKILNKGFTRRKVLGVIENCHKLGIKNTISWMVGLPTQTEEDLLRDLSTILNLVKKYDHIITINIKHLRIERDSFFYNRAAEYGIKLYPEQRNNFSITIPHSWINPKTLTRECTEEIIRSFYWKHLSKYNNIKIMFPKFY